MARSAAIIGRMSAAARENKRLSFVILSGIVLVAVATATVFGVAAGSRSSHGDIAAHAVLRSSCSSTLYPELCFTSIAAVPGVSSRLATLKDVIEAALEATIAAVNKGSSVIRSQIHARGLTRRQKTALGDCLEDIDETLDELRKTEDDLKIYPGKKSLSQHADDLKTLLSAAMTNQDSCLDGFSSDDKDKRVRRRIQKTIIHVYHMCSNALAMICNMTTTDMAKAGYNVTAGAERRLEEQRVDDEGFPVWLSAGDRRLLQAPTVTPNTVVAADGSGNYRTVSAAVAAAPDKSNTRYVIRIKAGVYRENVEVPKKKTNLMFFGDGRRVTIITGNRNVKDGSTTFKSATVAVVGGGFLARGVTFQNTAGPEKHQAVALRVGSDLSAFYDCDILAYQDTLYVHSLRHFFRHCLIAGTVDFIFGNGASILQDCDIHARRPSSGQKNMVTAQGRDDPNQNTGISIQKCRIGATSDLQPVKSSFPTFLGRPWKQYSRTVIMQTEITDVIDPKGWHEWNGDFALNTLYYAEYQNTGAGAGTARRVTWKGYKVITNAAEAQQFTAGNFIGGGNWLRSTGFPFALGL